MNPKSVTCVRRARGVRFSEIKGACAEGFLCTHQLGALRPLSSAGAAEDEHHGWRVSGVEAVCHPAGGGFARCLCKTTAQDGVTVECSQLMCVQPCNGLTT